MPAYKVRVTNGDGTLVVGATLYCVDDAAAEAKFLNLPIPPGRAELSLGGRVLACLDEAEAKRTA